jgi:formylglycine-generating enzyme required for sulfatase activity
MCLLVGLWVQTTANNIQVSNVNVRGRDLSAGANNASNFVMVRFNISWENSWRSESGPSNWDAAWVFAKFRVGRINPTFTNVSSSGTTVTVNSTALLRAGMPVSVTSGTGAFASNTVISSITNSTQFVVSATPSTPLSGAAIECSRIWEHARLHSSGHTASSGSTIENGLASPFSPFNSTTNPVLGVFMYRSSAGFGNVAYNGMQLRWNYGANGLSDNAPVTVQVFAIEMVYVPGGVDFNVGGGGGVSAFTSTTINTALATTAPSGAGSMGGAAGGYPSGQNSPANASWPNGYNSIYCMKYEISQGQYRDFLNTLSYRQQDTRTATAPSSAVGTGALSNSARNGIDVQTSGVAASFTPAVYACNLDADASFNESVDGEWIGCNFLSFMDGSAYLDWAGLRPMTELEFEKICRGNQPAVTSEYAWGTTSVVGNPVISNGGTNTEGTSTTGANAAYGNSPLTGPMRVGSFAGPSTSREQAGATYYGVMDMSGNLYERIVNIATIEGRDYTGIHGDGLLSNAGNANTASWPGLASGEVTDASGSGFKGGMWSSTTASQIRVSDRQSITSTQTIRNNDYGFRGVRTSPPPIVTNGLLVWYDAGINASYPGSGTAISDLSPNANNGTLTNGPTATTDGGGAISFDGTDDYISVGNLSTVNNLTVQMWVKVNSNAGNFKGFAAAKGASLDYDSGFNIDLGQSSGASFNTCNIEGGFLRITNGTDLMTSTVSFGTWVNICYTVSPTTVQFYLNGQPEGSTARLNNASTTIGLTSLVIGARVFNLPSSSINANIADTQIYNRALSADEVYANFNAQRARFGY